MKLTVPVQVNTLRPLQIIIRDWADRTFDRSARPHHINLSRSLEKMERELEELWKNPGDPEELADVGILLLDLAAMAGVDLYEAMVAKMEKNFRRVWEEGKDGLYQHVGADSTLPTVQELHLRDQGEDSIDGAGRS